MPSAAEALPAPEPFKGDVPEAEKVHYDALRQARDWSWETLADYFGQQVTDPASPRLAAWARSQAEDKGAAGSARARKQGTEKRG